MEKTTEKEGFKIFYLENVEKIDHFAKFEIGTPKKECFLIPVLLRFNGTSLSTSKVFDFVKGMVSNAEVIETRYKGYSSFERINFVTRMDNEDYLTLIQNDEDFLNSIKEEFAVAKYALSYNDNKFYMSDYNIGLMQDELRQKFLSFTEESPINILFSSGYGEDRYIQASEEEIKNYADKSFVPAVLAEIERQLELLYKLLKKQN